MKFYCKCGFCLTKELTKVDRKDAWEIVGTRSYGVDDNGEELIDHDCAAKQGIYFKRKFKGNWWFGNICKDGKRPNTYCISHNDLVEGAITNTSKGCCRWDYFDVQCPNCKELVGDGGNDCWQNASADLVRTKVKIGN